MESKEVGVTAEHAVSNSDTIGQHIETLPETGEKNIEDIRRLEAVSFQYTKKQEARYLRKIDGVVLGYVSGAYILAYMDRGNIGNANTAGMSADLGITDAQYRKQIPVLFLSHSSVFGCFGSQVYTRILPRHI